jgi:diaminohydroxyphosphoribosylaminopyrimidine deaminase/5-amino-6-(5-phosphoribosylamino)uracil reductase
MNDNFYMGLALDAAWPYQGLTYPNPAVGCVIVDKNGAILAISAHRKRGEAHAELSAVALALLHLRPNIQLPQNPNELHAFILKNHSNLLKDATVYVTLEPCSHYGSTPPCSLLLGSLHVKRVCIGVRDPNPNASGGMEFLKSKGIDIELGICAKECADLINPFRAWQNGHFGFVKLAMSLNGVMSGGKISSLHSRTHMHAIRDKLTLLAIGGNTLRQDNPKLDSRLVNGKAPDVLVLSKQNDFDKDANIFKIQNRKVYIESSWERFFNTPFGMIEAGPKLFENLPKSIKYMLLYRSNSFKEGIGVNCQDQWKMLWQGRNEEDSFGWFYRE